MNLKMKMQKFKDLPFVKRLAIGSGGTFMFGIILGYVLFPVILKHQVKKEMSLRNKTDMKEMWVKLPFPLEFAVWAWNVTNPEQAQRGAKPIIKEVGPFVYDKWLEKVNLIENKAEDSIEYNMKNTYYFNQEKSGSLTGDEMVYSPHLLMIATANYVATKKASFLKLATKALDGIYRSPPHIFPLHRVADILFDGVKVPCNITDFAPKAICTAYRAVESLKEYEPNFFKYSYFADMNGTSAKRYKVLRGIKNITDVGRLIEYDGKDHMDFYEGDLAINCNTFRGTDATIFRPFLTEKDELWTVSPELCKSFGTYYEKRSSYRGIKAYRYLADFGDIANEPQNQCFCTTPDTCPPRGMLDVSECTKGPIYLSLPHMYKVDPSVQNQIIGQNPQKEKHEIFLDMEPISGTPLKAKKRVQLNCPLLNIPEIELFKDIPHSYLPVIWFEETLALNKTYIRMLNFQLFYPSMAVSLIKWLSLLGGLAGSAYSFFLHRVQRPTVFGRPNTVAVAPPADDARSANNSASSQNNNDGISPSDKDHTMSNLALPGRTDRY